MRCGYCPYAARALDSVAADFPDSMVVIAYHRRVAGDTLSPGYAETRMGIYYSSGGEPATTFDGGNVVRTSGPEYNYPTFHAMTVAARNVVPGAQLGVSAKAGDSVGTVTVWATGVSATPTDTFRLSPGFRSPSGPNERKNLVSEGFVGDWSLAMQFV